LKVHINIIAIIIFIVVTILSSSTICYQFVKVYALLPIQKSSLSASSFSSFSLPSFELANTNSINSSISSPSYPSIENFNIYPGYTIQPVIWNLTLPSSVAFDNENNMYIAEAGFVYGGLQPIPRILKVDSQNGNISILVDRKLNGPITDIEFYNGKLYVSHRGVISVADPQSGLVKDILTGLPSTGDHHNNQIAIGTDNRIYFGQGEATNSGVVGEDNFKLGWLKTAPQFHDTPAKNITLSGENFVTANPLTAESNDTTATGVFVPFGTSTYKGQVIPGNIKCNGCILSANLDGTDLRLIGWGFRSAYGISFFPDEPTKLLVTVNGADERGSRPIANDTEKIYTINISSSSSSNSSQLGKFYGWPDFFGNAEPATDPKFQSQGSDKSLQFVMQNHPPVEKPLVELEVGSALAQVDFSSLSPYNNTNNFGFKDMAFIAQFGIMVPISHLPYNTKNHDKEIVGQKVIMFNSQNKSYNDFISLYKPDTSFRPVGIEFNKNENALYITSIGKVEVRTTLPNNNSIELSEPLPWYYPNTGIIWKVTKTSS
jgi:glucose/arabinose dehydrogenase